MKKMLALFALVAISVAVVVFTAVHGQNDNASKFRRARADKRIANQYIVVLKDDVADVEGEAIRLRVSLAAIAMKPTRTSAPSKVFQCACLNNKRRDLRTIRESRLWKKTPWLVWEQLRRTRRGDWIGSISETCLSIQPTTSTLPAQACALTSSIRESAQRILNSAGASFPVSQLSMMVWALTTEMDTELTLPALSAVQLMASRRT